uniref:(northern house mosquito) hypothetical protein n=1 Tax=Culex pipiens TaxID=7175 RepID=A0A8D8BHN8_CULPI
MKRFREFILSRKDSAGLGGGCGGFCRLVVDPCDPILEIDWSWSCLRPSRGLGKWKLPGRLFRRGGGNGPPTPASPFGGNGGLTAEGVAGVDAAAFGTSTGVLVCV